MEKPGTGMVMSGVAHAALLIYAAIGFSSASAFDPHKEAVPVEVVSSSELDQLTKGHQQAKEQQANKVQAKKVAAVDAKPKEMAPEAKEDVATPPPPPPPEAAEPPPEPKPPEPKPAEAPPPPEPAPTPEPKKAEAEPKPAPPTPAPKPPDLPKPEKKVEKKPEKKPQKPIEAFNPSKIMASLADKRAPGQKPQQGREVSATTSAGTASGTASQLSLSDNSRIGPMLYDQIVLCIDLPSEALRGRRDLVATIKFSLTEQGVLVGQPQLLTSSSDPLFSIWAEAAMRAVYACTQPTSPIRLPAENYAFWQSPEINFIPPD